MGPASSSSGRGAGLIGVVVVEGKADEKVFEVSVEATLHDLLQHHHLTPCDFATKPLGAQILHGTYCDGLSFS